jgi:hypothetical protein
MLRAWSFITFVTFIPSVYFLRPRAPPPKWSFRKKEGAVRRIRGPWLAGFGDFKALRNPLFATMVRPFSSGELDEAEKGKLSRDADLFLLFLPFFPASTTCEHFLLLPLLFAGYCRSPLLPLDTSCVAQHRNLRLLPHHLSSEARTLDFGKLPFFSFLLTCFSTNNLPSDQQLTSESSTLVTTN